MTRRLLPLLAFVLVPSAALADDPKNVGAKPATSRPDPSTAQGLFYEARALMKEKRFSEACPKLEESLRLDPGLGTQFNLADCNEQIGKIATAWVGFLEVAAQAKATNQLERERVARRRGAALEARVPKLVVEVSGAPQGLEVKRDGVVIRSTTWGTPIPVDPGIHKVSATAPGKQTWETTVATVEGKTARVSVPRDFLRSPTAPAPLAAGPKPNGLNGAAHPVASGATTTTLASPLDIVESFPPPVVESAGSTERTLGWIVMGVGAVGLGVGAAFGLSSLGKRDESRGHCVVDACDSTGVELRDDAIRYGNIATIVAIAGGATVAGGLVLVLTAPKGAESRDGASRIRTAPRVGLGAGGLILQGHFQ